MDCGVSVLENWRREMTTRLWHPSLIHSSQGIRPLELFPVPKQFHSWVCRNSENLCPLCGRRKLSGPPRFAERKSVGSARTLLSGYRLYV